MKRITWTPLMVDGAWNPKLRAAFDNHSGAYAIRHAKTKAVVYVGESTTGRGWTTLTRHFQDASGKFAKRNMRHGGTGQPTFTRSDPGAYEGALWVTSSGLRSSNPDQKARDEQARLIRKFKSEGHKLENIDDGMADDDFPFGANANPGDPDLDCENATRHEWNADGVCEHCGDKKKEKKKTKGPKKPNPDSNALVVLGWLVSIAYKAADGRRHVLMFGPRKNPAVLCYRPGGAAACLVIMHRPMVAGASSAKGKEEYKRTHWGSPGTGEKLVGMMLAGPSQKLGVALEVTYATEKGGDLADWHHTFGDLGALKAKKPFRHPTLHAATIKGRQLVRFSGGTYTVTTHGIVG